MIKIKLDDSHILVNENCKTKLSILEKVSELLSKNLGLVVVIYLISFTSVKS